MTVRAPLDPESGMVMDLRVLKRALASVLEEVDHRHLDIDVPFFRGESVGSVWSGHVSTSENLAVFIWQRLRTALPQPSLLYEVRLHETDKNVFVYRGEEEIL